MKRALKPDAAKRWRVYGGRGPAMVMSVRATTADEAVAIAAATLVARPDPHRD